MLEKITLEDFGPREAKMSMDIKFSKLNVVAGLNGSGKTVLFKSAWFMGFTLELYKTMLMLKIPKIDELFHKEASVVFDMTFTSKENISGAMMIADKDNSIFDYSCSIEEGNIATFNINVLDLEKFKVGDIANIQYNSKDARTFSQYEKYLNIKRRLGFDKLTSLEDISEFKDLFQIYDMLWFEQVKGKIDLHEKSNGQRGKISKVMEIWDSVFESSREGTDAHLPQASDFVFKDSMIYIDNDDIQMKKLSDYDMGTQSMIMMTFLAG